MLDGPFAETKEALLGFWVFDAASLDEALGIAREFASHMPGGTLELRPVKEYDPGGVLAVTEIAWIGAQLTAARPRAVGALLRYFRDLDLAEEAFQEASLGR